MLRSVESFASSPIDILAGTLVWSASLGNGQEASISTIGQTLEAPAVETPEAATPPSAGSPWPRRLIHYGVAFAILFGLWYFDRLRFEDFIDAGLDLRWALAALALFLPNYLIAALRLQLVLRGLKVECTFAQALSFTFCGLIGELALPFIIGGDLVKAVYVSRSSNRSTGFASVMADRLIGLLGLCVFALLAALAQIQLILQEAELRRAMLMLVGLSGSCLLGCVALVLFQQSMGRLARRILGVLPAGDKILTMLRALKQLCMQPHLWASLTLSALGHGIWAIAVIFLAYALGLETPFVATLLVLPIVAFCNIVSFAGGIGGGLLAFEYLFHHVLGAAPGDGARLGVALPILLTVSKVYALPWLFGIGKARQNGIVEHST